MKNFIFDWARICNRVWKEGIVYLLPIITFLETIDVDESLRKDNSIYYIGAFLFVFQMFCAYVDFTDNNKKK